MKKIAILIPSRDRSHKIERLHNIWIKTTDEAISTDCIIVLDEDNEHTYPRLPNFLYEVVPSCGKRGITYPLNQAAVKYYSSYEYIGFMGDDHCPNTIGWNSKVYEILSKNKPYSMAYTNDLIQGERLATHIIMDSLYIHHFGYMIHPSIQHLYGDDFYMYIGKYMNNIHYLPDVIIEHEHYSTGKSEEDDLYKELNCQQQYESGKTAYDQVIASEEFQNQLKLLHSETLPSFPNRS